MKTRKLYDCDLSPNSFFVKEVADAPYATSKDKIGIFSFFSGAGFLDLGFETENQYEIQFVNEFHLPFLQVYRYSRKNLGMNEPVYGYCVQDVNWLLTNEKFPRLKSLVEDSKLRNRMVGFIGGPPCPDFSVGGKNRGQHGENGKLSDTYVELICRLKPDFFLFENVKGLYRTEKHRIFFEELKNKLTENNYVLTEHLVNALSYGVPQDRERILLVGFLKHSYNLGCNPELRISQFPWKSNECVDLGTLKNMPWPHQSPFKENQPLKQPMGIDVRFTVQHWFNKNKVSTHPNAEHFFKPRNGLKKFLVIAEGDDKKKSYKRLHRWRYSPTAAYGNNEVHLHPYLPRRISAAEALAIQSLPINFLLPPTISLSDMFKTIGNGVPFLLANGIAKTIAQFINEKE